MGSRTTIKQVGAIFPILCALLAGVMICLGIAMIWVTLLAPHFGNNFVPSINQVNCEVALPLQSKKGTHPPIEKCYKVEDVLALNKALNMSDTLSLLGLLLAVFAFISPLFSYFTLQQEKQSLQKNMEVELGKLLDSTSNQFPKILSSIELFKVRYQNDKIQASRHRKKKSKKSESQLLSRFITDANEIATRLISLMNSDFPINEIFIDINNYLKENDISQNAPHIKAIKLVLRELYNAAYFGSYLRKKELKAFLEDTLKINLNNLLHDE